jgi:signal peptidase I
MQEEPLVTATEVPSPPGNPSGKKKSRPFEVIETIVVALLLAIVIRTTVAEARYIPSTSMEPTLLVGDRLIIEKLSFYVTKPQRGDILVFYPPRAGESIGTGQRVLRWLGFTGDAAYIKRVIGLPGETIEIREGQVLINGEPLAESYTKEPPYYTSPPLKIPPNSLYMMGDNRNNSQDSFRWGPLPVDHIIGKAVIRFWPLPRIGLPL